MSDSHESKRPRPPPPAVQQPGEPTTSSQQHSAPGGLLVEAASSPFSHSSSGAHRAVASDFCMQLKLVSRGTCTLLLLREPSYAALLDEIAATCELSVSDVSDRRQFSITFIDTAGDRIALNNAKSFENVLEIISHSDAESIFQQGGIKLFLTPSEKATETAAAEETQPQADVLAQTLRALHVSAGEDGEVQLPKIVHAKYKTEECKDFSVGHCLRGDRCSFLHSGVDDEEQIESIRRSSANARGQIAQLNRYLGLGAAPNRPCSFFSTPQGCSKGSQCTFSHDLPSRDSHRASPRGPSRGWTGGATSGFKSQGGRGRPGGSSSSSGGGGGGFRSRGRLGEEDEDDF